MAMGVLVGRAAAGLEGSVVLVTGAGRGQGRNHCLRLAESGAAIIATDVCAPIDGVGYPMASLDDLATTAELVGRAGGRISTHVVDVRDGAGMARAVDEGVRSFGRLSGVVANAGICAVSRADDLAEDLFGLMMAVNVGGVWNTCAAAIPHLRENGGGSMVLISSSAGRKGVPFFTAYSASKHGLVGLMQSLALELATASIRVNTVHPTGVDTAMTRGLAALGGLIADQPELGAHFVNALPMATVTPDDVSDAVLFLLSDRAAAVTGLTMTVDAGMSVR